MCPGSDPAAAVPASRISIPSLGFIVPWYSGPEPHAKHSRRYFRRVFGVKWRVSRGQALAVGEGVSLPGMADADSDPGIEGEGRRGHPATLTSEQRSGTG
jgi:hypothetical protein